MIAAPLRVVLWIGKEVFCLPGGTGQAAGELPARVPVYIQLTGLLGAARARCRHGWMETRSASSFYSLEEAEPW